MAGGGGGCGRRKEQNFFVPRSYWGERAGTQTSVIVLPSGIEGLKAQKTGKSSVIEA